MNKNSSLTPIDTYMSNIHFAYILLHVGLIKHGEANEPHQAAKLASILLLLSLVQHSAHDN